jgi:phage-related holin
MKETLFKISHELTNPLLFIYASIFTVLSELFEKYLFNDWQYLIFMVTLVFIDSVLGAYAAYKRKELSSTGWGKIIEKLLIYFSFLVMTHVLMFVTINGEKVTLLSWLDDTLFFSILIREAISVVENAALINPALIPKWLLAKLKSFDNEGNPKLPNLGSE